MYVVLLIQCDQMARLFLNIFPFTAIKIGPKQQSFAKSWFKMLPNLKEFAIDYLPLTIVAKFRQIWSHC